MRDEIIQDLLDRVRRDPSVLFLGQNYLASKTGINPFFRAIEKKISPDESISISSYRDIWSYMGGSEGMASSDLDSLDQLVGDIPEQAWLRSILGLRWSTIYTSSVDDILTRRVGDNFSLTPITSSNRQFKREYLSKRQPSCVYLFDRLNGEREMVPAETSPRSMFKYLPKVDEKIIWIFNEMIPFNGVMVIDGWDPLLDWVNDQYLLKNAFSLGSGGVYLFGATPRILEMDIVASLMDEGILIAEEKTFAQSLEDYGLFEDISEQDDPFTFDEIPDEPSVTITLNFHRSDYYAPVLLSDLSSLDSQITLLDDSHEMLNVPDLDDRAKKFAQFLVQQGTPNWSFFHEKVGFYFKRSVDEHLVREVENELLEPGGVSHRLILLEGPSNSGKSTSLAHLAMKLKRQKKYPVFFISGEITQTDYKGKLKAFIQKYFMEYKHPTGERIDKVVVIWDGNNSMNAEASYLDLRNALLDCNVLLVGSCYLRASDGDKIFVKTGGKTRIRIQSALDTSEEKGLENVIESLGNGYSNRFRAIRERGRTIDSKREINNHIPWAINESRNLLVILQRLFQFEFNPEFTQVRELLQKRLRQESNITEESTEKLLQDYEKNYAEEFYDTYEVILEKGIAASWQLKLQDWIIRNGIQENQVQGQSQHVEKSSEEYEKRKHVQKNITDINTMLAMAGQYSVPLPLTLLLRVVQEHNGNFYGQEARFLVEVLREDTLVRSYTDDNTGETYVAFRHSYEAENYMNLHFKDYSPEERKELEVNLLYKLMDMTRFQNDDPVARTVLALVRQFGPNSRRRPSDERKGKHRDYDKHIVNIAEHLIQCAENDAEATLVYAHFLREYYMDNRTLENRNLINKAKSKLREVINKFENKTSPQYSRLLVELCANLVSSLPREHESTVFEMETYLEIRKNFYEVIKLHRKDERNVFSSNNLLDIWLNAFLMYAQTLGSNSDVKNTEEFQDDLAFTVETIAQLLDLHELESAGLLGKIDEVYEYTQNDLLIEKLEQRLQSDHNDTFLYLKARRLWINKSAKRNSNFVFNSFEELVQRDLYMIPDLPTDNLKLTGELKEKAKKAGMETIKLLEHNKEMIKRAKSTRCLAMLIRSKWLVYTGNMPFEEKQTPSITREQWSEMGKLCGEYIDYDTFNNRIEFLPAYFIRAMYDWIYTPELRASTDHFRNLRNKVGAEWFKDRVVLCIEGSNHPRLFKIDVVKSYTDDKKLVGRISTNENEPDQEVSDFVSRRSGLYIPPRVLKDYLFGGIEDPKPRNNISKPCTIRFNMAGPLIGPASVEKAVRSDHD